MRKATVLIIILLSFLAVAPATGACGGTAFVGQWVWSQRDAQVFHETFRSVPNLVPSVWVGTISVSSGMLIQRLANAPDIAGDRGPVAVVVRFDDSFSSLWGKKDVSAISDELDGRFNKLIGILADTGVGILEVQLDYDCPVRRLHDWSRVVWALKAGSLRGRDVWITSLPSHMREPKFGLWFRGCVTGHILQVFDTGVTCDTATVAGIAGHLRKQRLAFRLGLGAFERTKGSRSTDHRHWFSTLNTFSSIPGYCGVWVFPGGNQWGSLL